MGFLKGSIGKKIGYIISGRRSYTDFIETPTFDALADKVFQNTKIVTTSTGNIVEDDDDESEITDENTFFFYDANAKLIIKPTKNDSISISGLFTNNDLNFNTNEEEDAAQDILLIKNQGVSLNWQGSKFKKWQHSLKAYYSNFDSDYSNIIREESTLEEENLRKNTVKDQGIDLNINYNFIPRHSIKFGYQYSKTNVFFQLFRNVSEDDDIDPDDDDEIPLPEDTRNFNEVENGSNTSNSLYAEYIYQPKNKGSVSLGVRASRYSISERFFIEPRINIEYPLSRSFRVKATAEKRFQPISQLVVFEDTQLRLENNIWTLSNDNGIPILESSQFSGGGFV